MLKTEEQILGIKKSSRLAAETLVFIEQYVIPGIKTIELNKLMDDFIRSNHGIPASLNYKEFPAATCISPNDVVCHGIPDDYVLKNGDILGIDIATILDGYFGDTCYTFSVGNVSPKVSKFLNIAKNSLYIGINQIKNNSFIGNIGYEINRYIERNNYSVCVSFTGHGVGLEFHEQPSVHHKSEKNTGMQLVEGMILTVEPIINMGSTDVDFNGWIARTRDRKLSAQYEHTILVKKNGFEILTDSELWAKLI